jgi:tetratricopeptide (TPR) repeat protein
LIDSFIEKVDSLDRLGNKESTLVGDISEKSTEEKDEFMTETLADLYVQQKNYQKAIEIYNKLILKFPEKKTYFAIQIKKTQSLIK